MKHDDFSMNITNVLAEVASAVVGQLNMDDLLNEIIEVTMEALHAEVCSIFLEDKEKEPDVIKCVAGSGFAKKIENVAKYRIGEGFTGTVALTGEKFNITGIKELKEKAKGSWEGRYDKTQWPSGESEFRNLLALPLKIKKQTLGVIKVENKLEKYGDRFSDNDLKLFEIITNVIALAIENARLLQQTKEQSKTISAVLTEVSNEFIGHFDMKKLSNKIISTAMNTLHAEDCSIFLEDTKNDPGFIKCVAATGFSEKIVDIASYKIGEGFTGMVFSTGKAFNIRNNRDIEDLKKQGFWNNEFDHIQWPEGTRHFRNMLALPLKVKDGIIGVIKVENKIEEFGSSFTDEDLTVLKTIAKIIAPTIENTRIHLSKTISRTIEFSAEHHQAGVDILNYFGTILKQKYPKESIKIKIEQKGSNVTMIVETPNGELKDKVEGTLDKYGLVVRGKVLPEDFFNENEEIQVLKLKNQLTNAWAKLENEQRIAEFAEKRVKTLEEDVRWLRNQVGNLLSHTTTMAETALDSLINNIELLTLNQNNDVFNGIREVANIINASDEISNEKRKEIFVQLQIISTEALKLDEDRKINRVTNGIEKIKDALSVSGSIASIWSAVEKGILSFFGL